MINVKSIKTQLIIYLGCFAIYLSIIDKDIRFLLVTSIAVISAMLIESFILFVKDKKLNITESSIISGEIIGFVLSSDLPLWIFLVASLLAIGPKHIIQVNKKHIFNPAAFGIFFSTLFFGASTQWKGTYVWYIIVPFGIYFITKIRKMEVLLGYLLTTFILFGIQDVLQKMPPINIFGYLSYFYIFVMLIEPKTTPVRPQGKLIFGIGVAALIFVLTNIDVRFDAELFSLLILNLTVPLLNKISDKRGGAL